MGPLPRVVKPSQEGKETYTQIIISDGEFSAMTVKAQHVRIDAIQQPVDLVLVLARKRNQSQRSPGGRVRRQESV